jgi:hypothetical protein
MPRRLLKFGGGSVDDYATLSTSTLIARPECGDELRHRLVVLHSTEAFDGFENAGGDPPYHDLPTAPPLDVSFRVTSPADETLVGEEPLARPAVGIGPQRADRWEIDPARSTQT